MKNLTIVALGLMPLLSLHVAAQQTPSTQGAARGHNTTYKCHIILQNNIELVNDYRRLAPGHHQKLMKDLVGRQASPDGRQMIDIKEVKECVEVSQSFKSAQSRELDRLTLR